MRNTALHFVLQCYRIVVNFYAIATNLYDYYDVIQTIQNSFRVILFELNHDQWLKSHIVVIYTISVWVEKIHALAKARASHPRTTATADPTGTSRLFTDPEEEREGKRLQFYSCRPWIISLAPISSNACRALIRLRRKVHDLDNARF